ncbi:DUF2865 domain-containing protein [Rhizobium rhizophilum]|uniref:DUF2865 domain-containing protein n=1 Tax=Rhizobium rhizophilum TaxID=1850373 RepID=A0ABY2QP09_9HYPH|nr:DUF2865 domain-containing protein [Rhizobium rhizophilum]
MQVLPSSKVSSITMLVVLGSLLPTAANASALCERLRDRLVLVQEGGTSPEINSYASAIAQQNLELRKARQDQRRLRCLTSSIVQIRPDGGNDCGKLATAISRMEANRDILAARLSDLRESRVADARAALVTALEANGCDPDGMAYPEEAERIPYLDSLQEPYRPDREAEAAYSDEPPQIGFMPTGNVRTLCVRTCDGGFFPISSQTSAMNFGRDAAQCQQMCPGTETELFFHAPERSETVDMVSAVTGRPYRDLPNAFLYRNRRTGTEPTCSCNMQQYYQRMTPRPAVPDYQSSIMNVGPKTKPPVPMATPPAPERDLDEASLSVRRVGPAFLPQDKGTIDLRNPAAPGPQPLQE